MPSAWTSVRATGQPASKVDRTGGWWSSEDNGSVEAEHMIKHAPSAALEPGLKNESLFFDFFHIDSRVSLYGLGVDCGISDMIDKSLSGPVKIGLKIPNRV